MIILTKLDDSSFLVNLDSIKYIEAIPDSLISFLNGDTVVVKESLEEKQKKMIEYKRKISDNNS